MHLVLDILTQQWFGRGHIEDWLPPLVVCHPWIKVAVVSKILLLLLGNSVFFQGLLPMRLEAGFELVQTTMPNCRGNFSLYQGKISSAETVSRSKSAPCGSKSLMIIVLAAHERHAIHPGFLDTGIVASTAGEGGLLLLVG